MVVGAEGRGLGVGSVGRYVHGVGVACMLGSLVLTYCPSLALHCRHKAFAAEPAQEKRIESTKAEIRETRQKNR